MEAAGAVVAVAGGAADGLKMNIWGQVLKYQFCSKIGKN